MLVDGIKSLQAFCPGNGMKKNVVLLTSASHHQVTVLFAKKVKTAAVPLFGLTLGHLGPIDLTENNKEGVAGAAW